MRKEKQSSAILHKRVDSIEFWRFFFCSCIVVMHFSETFQSKLYGEVRFGILPGAGLGVDFFFILSGYLMMDSYIRGGGNLRSPIQYIAGKIRHLYVDYLTAFFLLFFSIVGCRLTLDWVIQAKDMLFLHKWEILMLHMSELGEKVYINYPTWYISVMLIALYFTYAMLWYHKKLYLNIIAPLIILIGGGYYANIYATILPWYDYNGILNIAWIRAMLDVALGCLAFQLVRLLKKECTNRKNIYFCNVAELLCILRIIFSIIFHKNGRDDFFDLLVLTGLIALNFSQLTVLSRILSNRISGGLGRISLPMYLNQALMIEVYFKIFGFGIPFHFAVVIAFHIVVIGSVLIYSLTGVLIKNRENKKWFGSFR